jgi:hypothetical protein
MNNDITDENDEEIAFSLLSKFKKDPNFIQKDLSKLKFIGKTEKELEEEEKLMKKRQKKTNVYEGPIPSNPALTMELRH